MILLFVCLFFVVVVVKRVCGDVCGLVQVITLQVEGQTKVFPTWECEVVILTMNRELAPILHTY